MPASRSKEKRENIPFQSIEKEAEAAAEWFKSSLEGGALHETDP